MAPRSTRSTLTAAWGTLPVGGQPRTEEAALPRSTAQRHPFQAPIHLDPDGAALARAREVRCVCARSPFCTGPAGVGFWDCDRQCKACRLPPWQPLNTREGDDA